MGNTSDHNVQVFAAYLYLKSTYIPSRIIILSAAAISCYVGVDTVVPF